MTTVIQAHSGRIIRVCTDARGGINHTVTKGVIVATTVDPKPNYFTVMAAFWLSQKTVVKVFFG